MKKLLFSTLSIATTIITSTNLYNADFGIGVSLKRRPKASSVSVVVETDQRGSSTKTALSSQATKPPLEEKHIRFEAPQTLLFSKPQAQQIQQTKPTLDERLLDNKSTLIVIMKRRVPLTQRDYTYESCLAWSNRNTRCVQLLIAKKEERVEWNMLPHIAFLHTFLGTVPFDMSTPLAKVRYKDEWIYLKKVFPMLSFQEKSFFKKKYTVEANWNEDTHSFDLVVLRRYVIPSNYERPSKKKI